MGGYAQYSLRRIYYRASAAALELVGVSGRALLDWVQQALTLSPGFVQVSTQSTPSTPSTPSTHSACVLLAAAGR